MKLPKEIIVEDPHTKVASKNGSVFIARETKGAARFQSHAVILAGSLCDPKPGIAHFFEHLPEANTENFPNGTIKHSLRECLGEVGAATYREFTQFEAMAQNEHFARALFVLGDLVCRPRPTKAHFLHEQETILDEKAFNEKTLRDGRSLLVKHHLRVLQAFFGANAPNMPSGNPQDIRERTFDEVMHFYDTYYTSPSLLVAMEGDVPCDAQLEAALKQFDLPNRTAPEAPIPAKSLQTSRFAEEGNATRMNVIFDGPSLEKDGPLATDLFNFILGMFASSSGPLYSRLRTQKPLIYDLETSFRHGVSVYNPMGLVFNAQPHKTPNIVGESLAAINDFLEKPDTNLFEFRRNSLHQRFIEFQKRNPEYGLDALVTNALYLGKICPRDFTANALGNLTLENILDGVRRWMLRPPAMLYEGVIRDDFPDHLEMAQRLAAIAPDRGSGRTPELSARDTAP